MMKTVYLASVVYFLSITRTLPIAVYIYSMNWAMLYTSRRTGDKEKKNSNSDVVPNDFLRDYDPLKLFMLSEINCGTYFL